MLREKGQVRIQDLEDTRGGVLNLVEFRNIQNTT
jgi:hypothetical protein